MGCGAPCGERVACRGGGRQAAAGVAGWADGPPLRLVACRRVRQQQDAPFSSPVCPAPASARLPCPLQQIQADLGFGHSNVIKAYEAVLTPSHLCLGGWGVGKWGWLQMWRQGQG